MKIVFVAVSTLLAISPLWLTNAQAAPAPVLSDDMYSGREKDPLPNWEKKHPRPSSKKKAKSAPEKQNSPSQTKTGVDASTLKQGAPDNQSK